MDHGGIFTGERLLADDPLFAADFSRHLKAYEFAQEYARGKRVLDAGCGDGYGTHLLAQVAGRALGVDRSADAVAVAMRRYHGPNLAYRVCELDRLSDLGEHFDVVCNFQVIEHLAEPRPFLRQVRQILEPGGCLIVTTPNRLQSLVENPYHVHEYIGSELVQLLREVFPNVEVHGVCPNERALAYDRARAAQATRILRLDPLGLRHLLPRAVIEWGYPKLARLVRRNVTQANGSTAAITAADFTIQSTPEGALDLLAVCRA